MMKHLIIYSVILMVLSSCSYRQMDSGPSIYPDYIGVTVPPNIAPLRFSMADPESELISVRYRSSNRDRSASRISVRAWRKMLETACGEDIEITVSARVDGERVRFKPFTIHVSEDEIDPFIAYRLIEPGYELWNEMGLYQRSLKNFRQTPIIENKLTDQGCLNCHSFCSGDSDRMLFHARVKCGGTYLIQDGSVRKLNTKTPETISALVYPQWHPSGKFVAFSVNDTKQSFHPFDENRVEVFDFKSDVVVLDVENNEVFSCERLMDETKFETFPTFSSDGRTLFYCSADSTSMPDNFDKVRYSLCSVSFDPQTRSFGEETRLWYDASAEGAGSVSFPRISPDGRFLMYTRSGYGNFSIWHKDADLHMIDLQNNQECPMDVVNSADVESYHCWSSNGRWVIFSSRRDDKLYTRLYIAHIDEDGNVTRPFLLPQRKGSMNIDLMKSYNIPEFITGPVKVRGRRISTVAHKSQGTDLKFVNR